MPWNERSVGKSFPLICCLSILTLLVSSVRAAQNDDEEGARRHAKRATATYNLGQYGEAAIEFEAAYKLVQDPALLFNVGQAYRLGGRAEKAIVAYKSYLRTAPPDAPDRPKAQLWKDELERSLTLTKEPDGLSRSVPEATVVKGAMGKTAPTAPTAAAVLPDSAMESTSESTSVAVSGPKITSATRTSPPPPPIHSAQVSAEDTSLPRATETKRPLFTRWWFWAIVGAVAVGTGTALIVGREGTNPDCLQISPCGKI